MISKTYLGLLSVHVMMMLPFCNGRKVIFAVLCPQTQRQVTGSSADVVIWTGNENMAVLLCICGRV